MKKFNVLFLLFSIFALIFVSCKTDPEASGSSVTSVEQRDENGHLTQITYSKNGEVFKTEYYEYLNKHDDESRLVKTIENDQVTFEMEECWKIAYCLQNNIYKYDGVLGRVYPNYRDKFGEINIDNKTMIFIDNLDRVFSYDIESGTLTGEYTFSIVYNFSNCSYEEIGSAEDGNRRIMILAED